jgi:rubrerythrin
MVEAVLKAIIGEATAVDLYSRLAKQAPNTLQRTFIEDALNDEQKHLQAFKKLYVYLTGRQPQYRIQPVTFQSYKEGLLYAMKDELEAHSYYSNMTLSTTDQLIRDTFLFAANDEIEHALTFSFNYQQT